MDFQKFKLKRGESCKEFMFFFVNSLSLRIHEKLFKILKIFTFFSDFSENYGKVPVLENFIVSLKLSFQDTVSRLKQAIISSTGEGEDYEGLLSDDDDDDNVSVEAPPSVPHKDRRKKNVSSFRNREEPPDDMDEDVPPLSVYKRKSMGDSRNDSEGPSTSRGPVTSVKRSRPANDVRRKRDIEDDDDIEFSIPAKRKVIGEVSSTANLHSDDEEEDLRRKLKKKALKKREERDKSPESALDITIHNVVGVVSSTASTPHRREEPTSSGRLAIRSPDMFTPNKINTLVTSDDDIFLSPKQSPKRLSKKSAPRRRDHSEELEKPKDNERHRSPKQAPKKLKAEEKRRTEYEQEEDFSPVRSKKPIAPIELSDDEDTYVTPKQVQQSKKKLARTLDDYYRPAPAKKQPSEDEFDLYERSLAKKGRKVNGSTSPKKAGPSATVPTLLSPRREEEEDDYDLFQSSTVKKTVYENGKRSSLPAPALMSPRRDYEEDDEFAMFSSSKKKKSNGTMSPKKAAPSTSVVLTSRVEDDYNDDFAMFQSSSSKKKKTNPIVPANTTPPRAVSPQKPAGEYEEEDDSDYVSPKSTPRKQKISVNSEDDEIVVKPTEQNAELSEPDDDDYVSPASSPIPKMGLSPGISDEEEDDLQLKYSSTKTEKKSAVPEPSNRLRSPVRSPQRPTTSTRPSQRYQVDTEDEEVEKIMMNSQKTSLQKSPKKMFQKEVEVQKTPQKAMFSPRRRTSDDKEDEEEESEVDKAMRLFETSSKKPTIPKKTPVSTQKPVQPIEDEDDDLADRIMATIRERKSLPTVESRVEPEQQDPSEKHMQHAVETEKEEEKEDELPQSPHQVRGRICGGLDMTRSTVDDDLMTSGPLVREDLVSPTLGLDVSEQMDLLQRKRPSYVGMPAPKDDRPDYHWIEDKRGYKRWMRKPGWLLALEAKEARGEGGMMSPMTSPAHDPEPTTEDEEPVVNEDGKQVQKRRHKRTTNKRRRTVWNNFGRKKKHSVKVVDTDDEDMPADLPEEVMTEDEEPMHVADVDTEEEEEEEVHSSTALPKRHKVQRFTAEEMEGEYFFTIDKIGRKRKWPRKNRPLPRPDVLANMIREGLVHAATLEQRNRLLSSIEARKVEEPKKVEPKRIESGKEGPTTEEPVKKRRGRPPKKKFIEVEQSPDIDEEVPGTSSIIRVPPFEVQTSLRSTCPEGEDDDR